MIIAFILAFFTGVFSVLLVEAFLLYKWWSSKDKDTPRLVPQRTKVVHPESLVEYLTTVESPREKESYNSLNLFLAFLWREWRDSPEMKNFFLKKMNVEFLELMRGRAAGKVIEQITIQDFSLGASLPVIKGATVVKVGTKNPKEVSQELDIALELEYSGGCHLAIQVDLLFSRSVQLAVKLVYLKGHARIQLSRNPCTHWSLAFYEEPEVEFEAESQFEGKNIPQLTSLIVNHLRKSLYKKHTLPHYKMRYHPFFAELVPQDESQQVYVYDNLLTVGTLEVNVIGCSRLPEAESGVNLYCSVSIDSLPWKQLAENNRGVWPIQEVEISREHDEPFGLTLSKNITEDDFGKIILIETVAPGSPAADAGIHVQDVLVAVDGQKIETLKQAAKLIRSKTRFIATLQRPPSRVALQGTGRKDSRANASYPLDFKSVVLNGSDSESDNEFVNIVVPLLEKHADSEAAKSSVREILTRSTEMRQKADKKKDKGTKNQSTSAESQQLIETGTDKSTRDQKLQLSKEDRSRPNVKPESDQGAVSADAKEIFPRNGEETKASSNIKRASVAALPVFMSDLETKKTKMVAACQEPVWNDVLKFEVKKNDEFVNVCVWSRFADKNQKDMLVGYITVPVMDLAMECVATTSCKHEQCYVLISPHCDTIIASQPSLRSHPGLKPYLCGGDITVVFRHRPSLADCDEAVLSKLDSINKLMEPDETTSADKLESLEPPKHHFNLTQFYYPTRCNYCNKKVWTKVAFQCRMCAMNCHKKCLQHCLDYTHCVRIAKGKSWFTRNVAEEDNTDSKPREASSNKEKNSTEKVADGVLTSPEPTKEDDIPDDGTAGQGNKDDNEKPEIEKQAEVEKDKEDKHEASAKEESDSDYETGWRDASPRDRGQSDVQTDIARASAKVKEVGREMFSNLPHSMRKNKLQEKMARLQVEIDEENQTRTEWYELKGKAKGGKHKKHIEAMISKSEERSQALAMLMLQYCSGMQSCADTEEESCQL